MASKYNNRRTTIDGITFDSKREAQRWCDLKLMEKQGVISDLKRQVPFELQPAFYHKGKKQRAVIYKADFTYVQDGELIIEDVKSKITKNEKVYKLKKKMMLYKGYEIKETE